MEIFKELNELGYNHYAEYTIEELDNLPLNYEKRTMEQSLVFRWFRENGLICSIMYDSLYDVYRFTIDGYDVYRFTIDGKVHFISLAFKTYEEAELACLKKLIEIVKNK